MGVAENGAADCSRRAGPRFEPSASVQDRPAHEPIDRDGRIRPDLPLVNQRNRPASRPNHEPADSPIGDEDIRSAAKHRHPDAGPARRRHGRDDFIAVARFEEPLGRSANPERCQRGQPDAGAYAWAEGLAKPRLEIGCYAHASTAMRRRSWAINAASASPGVHT